MYDWQFVWMFSGALLPVCKNFLYKRDGMDMRVLILRDSFCTRIFFVIV